MGTKAKSSDPIRQDMPADLKEMADVPPGFNILGICKYHFARQASEGFQLRLYIATLFFVLALCILVVVFKEHLPVWAWVVSKVRGVKWSGVLNFWKGRGP